MATYASPATALSMIRELTSRQRKTFAASFLGWTLDAFDFFMVVLMVPKLAPIFHVTVPQMIVANTLTLMFRPLGALIFGYLADRFGRKVPLMIDIVLYSALEFATAFSPNFTTFVVLRVFFGIAMGGEWGLGAALALETLPAKSRGLFSGILQEGYALGYLLAALAYFTVFPVFGWRGMFVLGAIPALLVVFIRTSVPESEAWLAGTHKRGNSMGDLLGSLRRQPQLFAYAIVLMAAFNFLSHGSQDLYPTFLQSQRGFSPQTTSLVTIVANVGAIAGGILFGALSQSIGRRRAIVTAALIGVVAIPAWVFSPNAVLLGVGAFLIQFFVQGAWGVIPAHLNELSPPEVRATFPGFTYQLGNLISAGAAQMEALFASRFPVAAHDGVPAGVNYAEALAIIMVVVFGAVAILTALGKERRGADLTQFTSA